MPLAMITPGLPEILILAVIGGVSVFLTVYPFAKIFEKAGFPGFYGLAMLVPLLNVFALFYLALADWPALGHNSQDDNSGSQTRRQIE